MANNTNGLDNAKQYIFTGAGLAKLASATITKITGITEDNKKKIQIYRGDGTSTEKIEVGSNIEFPNVGSASNSDGTVKIKVDGTVYYPKVEGVSNLSVSHAATADSATTAGSATNAQYATYDAGEASKTTKTTLVTKLGTIPTDLSYDTSTQKLYLKIGNSTTGNGVTISTTDTKNTAGSTATANKIWLIGATSQAANPQTYSQDNCYLDATSTTNAGLHATRVYNAVFNDYAEYRTTIDLTPGHVVIDQDDGSLVCTVARLQPGAQVISDTYGTCMGQTFQANTPIAVAGRVLVYTYQSRENYHAGMAVCSAPNGTIDIMTREEIRDYPDCIVGIVSEIPEYETWGTNNVKVDGRIWVRIK